MAVSALVLRDVGKGLGKRITEGKILIQYPGLGRGDRNSQALLSSLAPSCSSCSTPSSSPTWPLCLPRPCLHTGNCRVFPWAHCNQVTNTEPTWALPSEPNSTCTQLLESHFVTLRYVPDLRNLIDRACCSMAEF